MYVEVYKYIYVISMYVQGLNTPVSTTRTTLIGQNPQTEEVKITEAVDKISEMS